MSSSLHNTMLTFAHQGTRNGPLVYIDNADRTKKYYCPQCKNEVFPKNRDFEDRQLAKHYAHVEGTNCTGGQMTLLHLFAQQIIAEQKSLMLPLYKYCDFSIEEPFLASFSNVVLEEIDISDTGLRPDCKCTYVDKLGNTVELWVEIYVSHKVNIEKGRRIYDRNKYCVEIDLNSFLSSINKHTNQDEDFLLGEDIKEKLTYFLLKTSNDRWWIHNPIYEEKNTLLKKESANSDKPTEIQHWNTQTEEQLDKINKIEAERKKTNEALNNWFSNYDVASAQQLIDIIQSDAEDVQFEGSFARNNFIFDKLTNDNIISYFIDNSPQNDAQQMLFDVLCKYCYPNLASGYFSIEKTIEEYSQNHTQLDKCETRRLSQYVIAYFFALCAEKQSILELLRNNPECRRNVLICCSFLYHHILSQNIHDYPTLIKFVVDKKPGLAQLCFMAVNANSYNADEFIHNGYNWLESLCQSADNNTMDMGTYKILNHVYPDIFFEKRVIL